MAAGQQGGERRIVSSQHIRLLIRQRIDANGAERQLPHLLGKIGAPFLAVGADGKHGAPTRASQQRYVAAIPWDDMGQARAVLTRTNAFVRPEEGDDKGVRLRIPDAADVTAAEST